MLYEKSMIKHISQIIESNTYVTYERHKIYEYYTLSIIHEFYTSDQEQNEFRKLENVSMKKSLKFINFVQQNNNNNCKSEN